MLVLAYRLLSKEQPDEQVDYNTSSTHIIQCSKKTPRIFVGSFQLVACTIVPGLTCIPSRLATILLLFVPVAPLPQEKIYLGISKLLFVLCQIYTLFHWSIFIVVPITIPFFVLTGTTSLT